MKTKANSKDRFQVRFQRLLTAAFGLALVCLSGSAGLAQTYSVLHTFGSGTDGAGPWSLLLSGTNLYGTTDDGGRFANGTLFRVNTDGSGYTVLRHFGPNDGQRQPGLLLSGMALYGTLSYGGSNGNGTVFKIGTDGSDFALLHTFSGDADGACPQGGLVLVDSALYGTTHSGAGTIFKVNLDGSGFAVLKQFEGTDGMSPAAGLVASGSMLYGTTEYGGTGGYGTVFKINCDGTGYTVLRHFAGYQMGDGGAPESALVLSGSRLYGTCNGGAGYGIVFSINTDGTGYAVIKTFNGGDGASPAGLVLSGPTLYGTTTGGGPGNYGEIFRFNTDGSGFAVVKSFTDTYGAYPLTTLLPDGTTLFGAAYGGGRMGCGVLFNFSLLPGPPLPDPFINTQPESRWVNAGETVELSVEASGTPPLSYQWFKDGVSLSDGGDISGANAAVLDLSNAFHLAAGAYWIIVSNSQGTATSHVATLSVQDPFFDTQPFNQSVFPGQTVQFTAVAGGTAPLTYQWLKDGLNLSDGGNSSGAQTPTLTRTNVSDSDLGVYSVVVSNTYGSLTSAPVMLNVLSNLPPPGTLAVAEISEQWGGQGNADYLTFSFGPMDSPIQIFDTIPLSTSDVGRLFSVTAAQDPDFTPLVSILSNGRPDFVGYSVTFGNGGGGSATYEYRFFSPLPAGGNGVDFQGFPIDNISLLVEELTFTHPTADWTDFTFRFKIFVNSEPWLPRVVPLGQTAEMGSSVAFRASDLGNQPLVCQWFFNATNALDGATTNSVLRLTDVQPEQAGAYTVVVTNVSGVVTSPPAMLSVIPPVQRRLVPALTLTGETGVSLHLEQTSGLDLAGNWLALDTVSLTNPPQFYFDLTAPLLPERFYRVWQTGSAGAIPALSLHLVPAITLTGPIGTSLRLDYINQFGPVDAWVALATVTLTNTSQLYFDVTAPGQPPRLYRVVQVP